MEADNLDIDFEAELRAFQAQRVAGRSKGRHLSDVLTHIYTQLDPKRYGGSGPINPATAQRGFLWEDFLSFVLARQMGHNKQHEILRDGIFMTLDGFSSKRWRVIEDKSTKMSARNPIRSAKFRRWHDQIMSYCGAMETLEAELRVLFLNGKYEMAGGRFGEELMIGWLMRYTKREVIETWDMILRAADDMDKVTRRRTS